MAYTEIHPITATVHKAIAYICDSEKTDDKLLVSSYGCSSETAHYDFAFTRQNAPIQSPNLAFHMVQAFKPGEVTPEEAHRIGQEMADELLKGKYSYIVTTHIDKGHVHNHLIFNAVDNQEYRHYNACKKSYYHLRGLSDNLCREHGLSVIEKPTGRGKSWYEWKMNQEESNGKRELRKDINKSIQITEDFEEFLAFMRAKGYQVKIGKYISFCPPGKEKFIRGSVKSLGKNYTKESIQKRIADKKNKTIEIVQYRLQYLISMPPEILNQDGNAGLKRWATKENLKRVSETYNQMIEMDIQSLEQLEEKICNVKEQQKELRNVLKNMGQKHKRMNEAIKYLKQYQATKEIYQQYKGTYFKDRFFRKHESDIIIYGAAKSWFKEQGMNPEKLDIKVFQKENIVSDGEREESKKQIKVLKAKEGKLQKINENLREYLQYETHITQINKER